MNAGSNKQEIILVWPKTSILYLVCEITHFYKLNIAIVPPTFNIMIKTNIQLADTF